MNVRDNIPPAITTVAQNMGIECDQATNVQAAFEAWLNNRRKHSHRWMQQWFAFFGVPGSYTYLGDTSSYPIASGQSGSFQLSICHSILYEGWKGRFCLLRWLWNTSVSSAFLVLKTTHPYPSNCQSQVNVETMQGVVPPTYNLVQYPMPWQLFTIFITCLKQPLPMWLLLCREAMSLCFSVDLTFGPYPIGAFSPIADASICYRPGGYWCRWCHRVFFFFFFNIVDEDGNLLGRTNNTDDQCGDGRTEIPCTIQDHTMAGRWCDQI